MATTRTPDEQIEDMAQRANVVVVLADLLRRAKRGEIRAVVVAAELTEPGDHATVYSDLKEPGQVARMIGLIHLALARLTGG